MTYTDNQGNIFPYKCNICEFHCINEKLFKEHIENVCMKCHKQRINKICPKCKM